MKKIKRGFTLIELLIVIALLGALAVALLAALDPLEQIKKGTDTGIRNTVGEIQSSMVRYTALQGGQLPFTGTVSFEAIGTAGTTPAYSALQTVISAGELKSDFLQLSGGQLANVFVTGVNDAGNQIVNVCYQPSAKSFRTDVNTKFILGTGGAAGGSVIEDTTGVANGGCPQATGTNASGATCYWCVR